ncbi:MAG: SPOR domain-containing protein, partial [Gemmatimonadaceae bacterium]
MRTARARTAAAAAGGLALAAALACGGDQTAKAPEAPAQPEPRPVPHAAIQLAAFTDSLAAARLRDSLDRAGWSAYLRRATASRGGR